MHGSPEITAKSQQGLPGRISGVFAAALRRVVATNDRPGDRQLSAQPENDHHRITPWLRWEDAVVTPAELDRLLDKSPGTAASWSEWKGLPRRADARNSAPLSLDGGLSWQQAQRFRQSILVLGRYLHVAA